MSNPTQVMGRRVLAAVIDGVIFTAAWVGLFVALAHKTSGSFTTSSAFHVRVTSGNDAWYVTGGRFWLLQALALAAGFAIYALLPALTGGSIGKLLLGLRIVAPDGQRAGLGKNLIRWLLLLVDDAPYFAPLVGFIVALTSRGHRRVGDMAAGTYVVRRAAVGEPVVLDAAQPGVGWAPGSTGAPGGGPPAGQPPPGWYPDPHGQARVRWWDGSRWTEHTGA